MPIVLKINGKAPGGWLTLSDWPLLSSSLCGVILAQRFQSAHSLISTAHFVCCFILNCLLFHLCSTNALSQNRQWFKNKNSWGGGRSCEVTWRVGLVKDRVFAPRQPKLSSIKCSGNYLIYCTHRVSRRSRVYFYNLISILKEAISYSVWWLINDDY